MSSTQTAIYINTTIKPQTATTNQDTPSITMIFVFSEYPSNTIPQTKGIKETGIRKKISGFTKKASTPITKIDVVTGQTVLIQNLFIGHPNFVIAFSAPGTKKETLSMPDLSTINARAII
jgi:hypothetical protein